MKKFFFVVFLVATLGAGFAHAQSAPIDLVVLVDTSESMLPYWKDTTDYIIKNILTGVLNKNDTFHLISFASHPELEISRTIESEKDIQAILARFLLLQPLGKYTDLVAAIQYVYQYVVDLPLATQKDIIILTDGIHDPPPGSRFPIKYGPNGKDISGNRQIIIETAQAMLRHGWHVHIIQYPRAGAPAPGTVTAQPGVQLLGAASSGSTTPATQGTQQSGGAAAQPGAGTASRAGQVTGGTTGAVNAGAGTSRGGTTSSGSVAGSATGVTSGVGAPSAAPKGGSTASGTVAGSGSSTGSAAQTGTSSAEGVGPASGGTGAKGKKAGESGLLNDLSKTLGVPIQHFETGNKKELANIATGSPALTFPRNLGNIGYDASVPFVIRNVQDQPVLIQLSGILYNGTNILRRPVNQPVGAKKVATLNAPIRLPVSLAPGKHSIEVQLEFNDSLRVSPHSGQLSFTLKKGIIEAQGVSSYFLPVLIGIVVLVLVVLIVIFIRRMVGTIGTAPAASVTPVRFEATHSGAHPVEMRVIGQNPNIGGRNVHAIGAGSRRTVGGGASHFLIYIYPCPAHIAEIVFDGQHYSFIPTKPEFFPRLSGELRDCLDKQIIIRPTDAREVEIVFKRYVSPLDELNRIMHLVDKPGVPAETEEST